MTSPTCDTVIVSVVVPLVIVKVSEPVVAVTVPPGRNSKIVVGVIDISDVLDHVTADNLIEFIVSKRIRHSSKSVDDIDISPRVTIYA